MKKLRIGVVGLGHRGRLIASIVKAFDEAELVAGCDLNPDNWYERKWLSDTAMAQKFPNALFFENYDKMLDEADLDAVIVETGADIHAEFCIKALQKNINVLTDIPVVASLKEAEDLWLSAQRSKAIISTGANPNEQKFAVMLKDFYERGALGKPYYLEAEYIHWSMPNSDMSKHLVENGDWRRNLSPIRYCTHSLGPLLSVVEEDLRLVSCFGTGYHADDNPSVKKHQMMCAQFQTESGVVVRLLRNGRCRAQIGPHAYRVFGTEGYMEKIERFDKPFIRFNSTKENDNALFEVTGERMPPAYANNPKAQENGHGGIDYAMLDHFFQALIKGEPAPIPLREGLRMTLPGIYAEESANRGGEVLKMYYPWDKEWKI